MADSIEKLIFVERDKGYLKTLIQNNILQFITSALTCPRCRGIIRDMCVIKDSDPQLIVCLNCKKTDETGTITNQFQQAILGLRVKCPLQSRGCRYIGNLRDLENHIRYCQEFILGCPQNCNQILKRKYLETHKKIKCNMRLVRCDYCGERLYFKEMRTHMEVCKYIPVQCVCRERIRRKDLQIHKQDKCLESVIHCSFIQQGCDAKFKRRFLESHLKENKGRHHRLRIRTLESRIINLESQNDQAVEEKEINKIVQNKEIIIQSEDLSQYKLVLNWRIFIDNFRSTEFVYGPTFTIPGCGIKFLTKCLVNKNTLILAVVVWPVNMEEAFSYKFWSIVVDQANNKLCEKQEGNYKCINNKEIIPASRSRPFEASMLIARYKLACLYQERYIKDGVLNVKVYTKK